MCKDKTDRKLYRCCLEYKSKYAEIGYYFSLIYVGAKNVENRLFLPVYIEEEKVTQGFLCIWLKDAAIWEHVIC